MIHIADAPSHGARYHNGCDDHHVEGDHGIPKLLLSIKQMNVEYVFGRMNAGTDKMIDVFNGDVGEKWIKSVPITSADEMTKAATTCMRTTMHATFSRLTSKKEAASKAIERVEQLTSTMPDWDTLPELRFEVVRASRSPTSAPGGARRTLARLVQGQGERAARPPPRPRRH